jgi:hypothetical protein
MNIRLKFHSKEVLYMLYLTLEVLFILYVISNHIILLDLNVYIFNTHKKEIRTHFLPKNKVKKATSKQTLLQLLYQKLCHSFQRLKCRLSWLIKTVQVIVWRAFINFGYVSIFANV